MNWLDDLFPSCDRCGNKNARIVRLIGGYSTHLCTDCSNKWHKYIINNGWFKKLDIVVFEMMKSVYNNQLYPENLSIEKETIERELFNLGEKWCKGENNESN